MMKSLGIFCSFYWWQPRLRRDAITETARQAIRRCMQKSGVHPITLRSANKSACRSFKITPHNFRPCLPNRQPRSFSFSRSYNRVFLLSCFQISPDIFPRSLTRLTIVFQATPPGSAMAHLLAKQAVISGDSPLFICLSENRALSIADTLVSKRILRFLWRDDLL